MPTLLKIDQSSALKMLAASVAPKRVYEDGHVTDSQATDRATALPLWRVSVFVMDADATHAPETISVTVPAVAAPTLAQLQPVVFTGLRVLIWAGGASLRADSVEPLADSVQSTSSFLSDIEEVER